MTLPLMGDGSNCKKATFALDFSCVVNFCMRSRKSWAGSDALFWVYHRLRPARQLKKNPATGWFNVLVDMNALFGKWAAFVPALLAKRKSMYAVINARNATGTLFIIKNQLIPKLRVNPLTPIQNWLAYNMATAFFKQARLPQLYQLH